MPTPLTWGAPGAQWGDPGLVWNGNLPENHTMGNPNIDAVLATQDIQAIKTAFETVLSKLPFAVNLTPDDRKKLTKTGSDSVGYVQDALTGLQANPTAFPGTLDATAFGKDVTLFTVLTELTTLAQSVAETLDDTRMAVGSEAMSQANQVYTYAKTAAKTTPGLQSLVDQLGARYANLTGPRKAKTP